MTSTLRTFAWRAVKVLAPVAILAWVVSGVDPEQWRALDVGPSGWRWMAVALAIEGVGLSLTFVRWHLLMRTVGLSYTLTDAFRLGSLGFVVSSLTIGAVGGDVVKSAFVAREQPERRAEAVITVLFDRVLGIYALMLVASAGLLFGGLPAALPGVDAVRTLAVAVTVAGGLALFALFVPGVHRRLHDRTGSGGSGASWLGRVVGAVRLFAEHPGTVAIAIALGAAAFLLTALAVFVLGRAFFSDVPSPADHLVIVPLAMVAGALPIAPAGLGTFEFAMDRLYALAGTGGAGEASGVLIALGFRAVTVGLAFIGIALYFLWRARGRAILADARQRAAS